MRFRKCIVSLLLILAVCTATFASALADVESLRAMNLYGAIIGKAYYTGDIDLKKAIEAAK